jgi:hypothetical protein
LAKKPLCINASRECAGPVEYRTALSGGTGKSYPRCEQHWERRLAHEEQLRVSGLLLSLPSGLEPKLLPGGLLADDLGLLVLALQLGRPDDLGRRACGSGLGEGVFRHA